jgi:aspartate-semialdehyde dehydrogenase
MSAYNVALVGATGAVGAEFLQLLESRDFPLGELRLLASSRSAGTTIRFKGQDIVVQELSETSFTGIDIAFFSAGGSRSKQYAAAAVAAGAVVVDNSSAFRMDPSVPLVVPEVNPDALTDHTGIIANPNCSTILLVMVLAPLLKLAPIRRVVVSTYQAASGAGAAAMRELETQTADVIAGNDPKPEIFPHPIAFNLFSHNTAIDDTGYNEEELKMVKETRKILSDDSLAVTATCIRVPIPRAHSESVNIEFVGERPSVAAIHDALSAFPGVVVVDDRDANVFPMPRDASGRDEVFVGRIREDLSCPNAIELFLSGDQILKGAALNGYQIAECLIERGLLGGRK